MCFKYTLTAASNHKKIGKHQERISKIRSLMNKHE